MKIKCRGELAEGVSCESEAEVVLMYRHYCGSVYCRHHGEQECRERNQQRAVNYCCSRDAWGYPVYWLAEMTRDKEETT